ncbi:MAG: hypothetical protein ACE5RI_09760 [Candidatus Nitrosomaritimum yanchengensis]
MKSGSPIIATILLIAISVVGGSILFVFAQGFVFDEQISLNIQPQLDSQTHESVLCKNTNLENIEKTFFYHCP